MSHADLPTSLQVQPRPRELVPRAAVPATTPGSALGPYRCPGAQVTWIERPLMLPERQYRIMVKGKGYGGGREMSPPTS